MHDSAPHAGAVLFTVRPDTLARFYQRVAGMRSVRGDADHEVLEHGSFRLIVHRIPEPHAREVSINVPPVVRERGAIKLSFWVADIPRARQAALEEGGAVYGPDREWQYGRERICDGYDPDGNVFQLVQL